MRVVVDTNVLISGILNSHGAPGQIVDLLLDGALVALYDDRVMDEYHEVLARPKFHFPPPIVETLLEALEAHGEHVSAAPHAGSFPDPDDRAFLEVALAGCAQALITGNQKHFPAQNRQGIPVMSPADFLKFLHKP